MARILIVDDEESIRLTLKRFLEKAEHEVDTAGSAGEAFDLMNKTEFDVIVTDIIMPGISGIDFLQRVHGTNPDIQVVLITGEPTLETAARAVRDGAFEYISKPISGDNIVRVVARAAEVKKLTDEKKWLEGQNRHYQGHLEELVEEQMKALRESEEELRDLYENAPIAYFVVDRDGIIRKCNKSSGELLAYDIDELVGKHIDELYTGPDEGTEKADAILQSISSGESISGREIQIRRSDGEPVWISLNVNPVRDENGAIIGTRSIALDITERKWAERELKMEANKRKNTIMNISHLLMTPITVVKGNLELIEDGKKEVSPETLSTLARQIEGLYQLIKKKLYFNLELMTVPTSDGFTPAKDVEW